MLTPLRLRPLTGTAPFSAGRLSYPYRSLALSRALLNTRSNSTVTEPPRRLFHRARTVARYTGYISLSAVFGVLVVGAGFFVHDVFTYSERHIDRVPISPLALHPETGGPKNLPIARVQVDDEDDEENIRLADKPKLVIVGGGWGVSCHFLLSLALSPKLFTGDGSASDFIFGGLPRHCHFIGNFHHLHSSPSMYVATLVTHPHELFTNTCSLKSCGCRNCSNSLSH